MPTQTTSSALRALVAGLVDYAGLFPPASLDMAAAAAAYADYLASPDAWMLGRFVVPAARLEELAQARPRDGAPMVWRVSALVGEDTARDARHIHEFAARHGARFIVDVAEARASTAEQVGQVARTLGASLALYIEVPHETEPRPLLAAVRDAGARAKIRTGGVTPEAFPTAAQVARFLARCAEQRVAFKATAGLHHPLRGEHRLTYRSDAPSGTMFGFLNVFVAAVLARRGTSEATLIEVLEERDGSAITFAADGLHWRQHHLTADELVAARASFAIAFGSCSFREPVDELQELTPA